MGLVSRMAKPRAMSPEQLEKMVLSVFGSRATSSGISVSSDTAMQQATVYSCVNVLQRSIGQLPCHLMQLKGKMREKATDDPLYFLLHDQPNEWMTAPEFWGMCISHLALRGNFFALKNRGLNLSSPVRELIPLAPGIVQEIKQDEFYRLTYKCKYPDGSVKDIPQSEIMHVRGMTMNGFTGVNPIEYIRDSIGLGKVAEQFGGTYFANGTHPGMIIEHPSSPSKETEASLMAAMSEAYSGLGREHRMMLLRDGMKAHKITIDPKDAQFLELRKYQKSEIVDIFFAMPLTLMSSGDNTPTFASAEQFSIGFIVYALMPWLVSIEKAVSRDLIPEEERRNKYVKFVAQGLQRGSFKEQMESFAVAIDKEILNPNECRELIDMNPYEGGDEYRTRTSTTKESTQTGEQK